MHRFGSSDCRGSKGVTVVPVPFDPEDIGRASPAVRLLDTTTAWPTLDDMALHSDGTSRTVGRFFVIVDSACARQATSDVGDTVRGVSSRDADEARARARARASRSQRSRRTRAPTRRPGESCNAVCLAPCAADHSWADEHRCVVNALTAGAPPRLGKSRKPRPRANDLLALSLLL